VTKSVTLTPNHLARRRQLVEAAQRVLQREGTKGCTSRAIARESGLNNGLIHYYFKTVDAVVDAAMGEMVDEIVARINAAAEQHEDPAHRFWSVIEAHLDAFGGSREQTVLWMDYWVDAMRSGRAEVIGRIDDAVVAAMTDTLEEAEVPEARARARAICGYVVGAGIRRVIRPQSKRQLREEILTMSGGLAVEAR
jgi:AcrR family transcriptional regulator